MYVVIYTTMTDLLSTLMKTFHLKCYKLTLKLLMTLVFINSLIKRFVNTFILLFNASLTPKNINPMPSR